MSIQSHTLNFSKIHVQVDHIPEHPKKKIQVVQSMLKYDPKCRTWIPKEGISILGNSVLLNVVSLSSL